MSRQRASHRGGATPRSRRRDTAALVRIALDHLLLLPLGAAIALGWANLDAERYFRFAHALRFAVNNVGMAFFFALVMQRIVEETVPGGALHTWRRWGLPIAGTVGGTIASAVAYLLVVQLQYEDVLAGGWPVACAVDVGFSYFIVRALFPRTAATIFLLALTISANAFVVVAVAFLYPIGPVHPAAAFLMLAAIATAILLNRRHVRGFWPYLTVCGSLSWWGFYLGGIQPALALVPIVPFMTHSARRQELLEDDPHGPHDSPRHYEHVWGHPVQGILLLFGLVNGGVLLNQFDTGTWAVLAAALAGRPVGIVVALALAVAAGLRLPAGLHWRDMIVIALAASSGFTLALFFASVIYPVGPVLTQMKIGALATAGGALVTWAAAWLLHAGRFARHTHFHGAVTKPVHP